MANLNGLNSNWIYNLSTLSNQYATSMGLTSGLERNAFAHCFSSALLTININATAATAFGDVNEWRVDNPALDENKDQWNNREGRGVGQALKERIRTGEYLTPFDVAMSCKEKITNGNLIVDDRVGNSDNRRMPGFENVPNTTDGKKSRRQLAYEEWVRTGSPGVFDGHGYPPENVDPDLQNRVRVQLDRAFGSPVADLAESLSNFLFSSQLGPPPPRPPNPRPRQRRPRSPRPQPLLRRAVRPRRRWRQIRLRLDRQR